MSMVEWKKLGDVCEVLRGKRLTKAQLNETEGYPVLHGGSLPMGYYSDYNRKANTTVVVNTGNAGCVFFYDKEFWSSDACFSLYPNERILDKFLYLYVYGCERILKGKIRAGAMPTIDANAVETLIIPIPSLSEQQRIIDILDKFAFSIENLKQQINLRRKQYEYYRDQLFDLEGKEGMEMEKLGDVCKINAGGDVPKDNFSDCKTDYYCIPIISNGIGEKAIYGYTDIAKISMPSVTIAARGTIGYAEYREYPYYPIVRLISATPLSNNVLNAKFLYYKLIKQNYNVSTSGIPQLTIPMIKKVLIPVPSISEQLRIVSILDTFEASIQNLEQQLAQREKQYEYYRNKLLTFE